MTDDGHKVFTIVHLEHVVLRWANKMAAVVAIGFRIGTILTHLDLEIILLLQFKFQLKSPNGSGG